jgi:hypothetical protein
MTDKEAPTVFDKNMSYQDFVKTIPPEEIEASQQKIPSYQEVLKTIAPKDRYTWMEMNEMVEREIRSVVSKMTDAIKEDIVGHFSEEHANHLSKSDKTYNRVNGNPLKPDDYAHTFFSGISIFNVYLIKVLHKIVDDYKYTVDYKKHSTLIRDVLDIALKNEDVFTWENLPKDLPNSPNSIQSVMPPGELMYAFMNKSLDKIPEYKDMIDHKNVRWASNSDFIRNTIQTVLSLLGMMIPNNIFNASEAISIRELMVHKSHWGLFAPNGSRSVILIQNQFINTNTNKINKPFLMRFLTIFREFYSFMIDEIDYDVPVKRGGQIKSQRRRTGNKKTRKQHQ